MHGQWPSWPRERQHGVTASLTKAKQTSLQPGVVLEALIWYSTREQRERGLRRSCRASSAAANKARRRD